MFSYFKKTIYRKIASIFLFATLTLIFSSYYVINWSFETKDSILDVHDAYLHSELIKSWDGLGDSARIAQELKNLSISIYVYSLDSDTLCDNSRLRWTNSSNTIDLCRFGSFSDTELYTEIYDAVDFQDCYVSFGEYEDADLHYPATFIAYNNFKYLLITNEPLKNEWIKFVPSIVLAAIFMLMLYLVVKQILSPISLMTKRITSLEKGDLDSSIRASGEDELAQLSHNFNKLISEIKKLLNQKERLLSDVSHEMRTPLSKIRLMLAMVPKNEKTEKIDKQILHLDAMITNILLSDKMSGAYANLDITQFSCSTLLDESLDLSINRNVLNVSKKDCIIYGDIIKLSVVIKNVLDNIEKYAKTKRPCEFDSSIKEADVHITIRDFGPGIDKNLLKQIKKPFTQGEKDKNKGFGLGMSICNKVLLAHGGSFIIKNNSEGEGATFYISFPLKYHGKK